jgi:hypothetical protein
VPIVDIFLTITRYASLAAAQKDIEQNLLLRQVMPQSRTIYNGAIPYNYTSGGTMICQAGEYIIELNPSEQATSSVMKVLDAVLAELKSTAAKPR